MSCSAVISGHSKPPLLDEDWATKVAFNLDLYKSVPDSLKTNIDFLKSVFVINCGLFPLLSSELQENVELITCAVAQGFTPPPGYISLSDRENKREIIKMMQTLPSPTIHKVCKYISRELQTDPSILQTVLNEPEPLLPEINQALWVVAINPKDYLSLKAEIQSNENFLKSALKLNFLVFYYLPKTLQILPRIIDFAITGATHYPLETLEALSKKCEMEPANLIRVESTKRGLAKKIAPLPIEEKIKSLPFYNELLKSDYFFSICFFTQELALLQNCDPEILNNSRFMTYLIRENPAAYQYCSRELKASHLINLQFLEANPLSVRYFEAELLDNREFAKLIIKKNSYNFNFISKRLQNDTDFILEFTNQKPDIFQYLPETLKNNLRVATVFIRAHPQNYYYLVSSDLKRNRDLLLMASHENVFGISVGNLPAEFVKDREIVGNFIRCKFSQFQDADEDFRNDANFVYNTLRDSFEYAKRRGTSNSTHWSFGLNSLPDTIKRDKRIAKLAVENKGHLIECFPAFWSDLEIATIAASNSKVAPKYIDRELMKHPLVIRAQNQLCLSKKDFKELDKDLLTKADQIEKIAGALIRYPNLAKKLSPEFLLEPSIAFTLGNRPNRLAWMHAVARGVLRRVAAQASQTDRIGKRRRVRNYV